MGVLEGQSCFVFSGSAAAGGVGPLDLIDQLEGGFAGRAGAHVDVVDDDVPFPILVFFDDAEQPSAVVDVLPAAAWLGAEMLLAAAHHATSGSDWSAPLARMAASL